MAKKRARGGRRGLGAENQAVMIILPQRAPGVKPPSGLEATGIEPAESW